MEAVVGKNSIIAQILGISDKQKKQLKENIKNFKAIIEKKEKEVEKKKKALARLYKDKAEAEDEYKDVVGGAIEDAKAEIKEIQTNIAYYELQIRETEDTLQKSESTITLLQKLDSSSLEDIKQIIKLIVLRITLYNADVSVKVVKITYINAMSEYILYSPRLMPEKYIDISSELSPILYAETVDDELKLLIRVKHPKSTELPLHYDERDSVLRIREDISILSDSKRTVMVFRDAIPEMRRFSEENGLLWDYEEYSDFIGVRDFVLKCRRKSEGGISVLRGYKRLLPMTDKAKQQQERYREWRKKYNTGKPTCEPYVVRDELYSQIKQERRKLYNRIYKIKNNKSKTAKDKYDEIQIIKERLRELRYQIHYFGESKLATKYKKK